MTDQAPSLVAKGGDGGSRCGNDRGSSSIVARGGGDPSLPRSSFATESNCPNGRRLGLPHTSSPSSRRPRSSRPRPTHLSERGVELPPQRRRLGRLAPPPRQLHLSGGEGRGGAILTRRVSSLVCTSSRRSVSARSAASRAAASRASLSSRASIATVSACACATSNKAEGRRPVRSVAGSVVPTEQRAR